MFRDGEHHFVDEMATIEFCGFIPRSLSFQTGDTIVSVRVRDESGAVGPVKQMVIRVTGFQ